MLNSPSRVRALSALSRFKLGLPALPAQGRSGASSASNRCCGGDHGSAATSRGERSCVLPCSTARSFEAEACDEPFQRVTEREARSMRGSCASPASAHPVPTPVTARARSCQLLVAADVSFFIVLARLESHLCRPQVLTRRAPSRTLHSICRAERGGRGSATRAEDEGREGRIDGRCVHSVCLSLVNMCASMLPSRQRRREKERGEREEA